MRNQVLLKLNEEDAKRLNMTSSQTSLPWRTLVAALNESDVAYKIYPTHIDIFGGTDTISLDIA